MTLLKMLSVLRTVLGHHFPVGHQFEVRYEPGLNQIVVKMSVGEPADRQTFFCRKEVEGPRKDVILLINHLWVMMPGRGGLLSAPRFMPFCESCGSLEEHWEQSNRGTICLGCNEIKRHNWVDFRKPGVIY